MMGAQDDAVPLPDGASPEDERYRLYVLEKVRRGLASAESEGVVEQEEAEARLSNWLTESSGRPAQR